MICSYFAGHCNADTNRFFIEQESICFRLKNCMMMENHSIQICYHTNCIQLHSSPQNLVSILISTNHIIHPSRALGTLHSHMISSLNPLHKINWRAPWKNLLSSTSMKLRKSLLKPVTRQNIINISSCLVLSPEIVMHDALMLFSERPPIYASSLSLKCTVYEIFDFKNAVTLKTGLWVPQGRWKCHHAIEHIWLPIVDL